VSYFLTNGPAGNTIILAFALMVYENSTYFEWCFREFFEHFKIPVLITDFGCGIKVAARSKFLGKRCKRSKLSYCHLSLARLLYQLEKKVEEERRIY
jgi:hypothetical protein